MTYFFNNTDSYEDESLHEERYGDAYDALMDVCIRNSRFFSLTYNQSRYRKARDIPELMPYQYIEYNTLTDIYYGTLYNMEPNIIRVYYSNDQTKEILCKRARSILAWRPRELPEDLTFFRADGSVFLGTMTHEGECWLTPREDEDVEEILQTGMWHRSARKDDSEEWVDSLWTAQRLYPQKIPDEQRQWIMERFPEWEAWPADEIARTKKFSKIHRRYLTTRIYGRI